MLPSIKFLFANLIIHKFCRWPFTIRYCIVIIIVVFVVVFCQPYYGIIIGK